MAKVPQLVPTTDLCPRCAVREAFCEPCHASNIAERYQERERIESEARTRAWREWDRERQRRHRMVGLRPAELASPGIDPLELGKEALHLLAQMRLQGANQTSDAGAGGGTGASASVGTGRLTPARRAL